jgi:hypothetical protein
MGWLFGKKQDFAIFSLPLIGALFLNFFTSISVTGYPFTFYLQHLFNLPHTYSTYWLAFGDKTSRQQNLTWLLYIPLGFLIMIFGLQLSGNGDSIGTIVSVMLTFHCLKQQHAWFFISMGKSASKHEGWINRNAIFAVTFGFVLAVHSEGHYVKTSLPFDKAPFPADFFPLAISWIFLSVLSYAWIHFKKWQMSGKASWPAHHLFLSTAASWGLMAIEPDRMGTAILLSTSHALPYLFLGYKYVTAGRPETKRSQILIPGLIYVSCVFLAFNYWNAKRMFHFEGTMFTILTSIHSSIVLSHYIFDMFLWKRSYNPGWTKVFSKEEKKISNDVFPSNLAA